MKTVITAEIKKEILSSISELEKFFNKEMSYSMDLRNIEKINKYKNTIEKLKGYLNQGWL